MRNDLECYAIPDQHCVRELCTGFHSFSWWNAGEIWEEIYPNNNDELKKFNLYRKLKLLLRFEIIKNIKKKFDKKLTLIGDDWNVFSFNSLPSVYKIKNIKKIYEGNICLDLGSMLGSVSLYSRSNQIIESGGLIIQNYQNDSKKIAFLKLFLSFFVKNGSRKF